MRCTHPVLLTVKVTHIYSVPLHCALQNGMNLYSNYVKAVLSYRRNWLLSACAYNTRQQENNIMCLIKSIRLTGSMRLIKSAKTR